MSRKIPSALAVVCISLQSAAATDVKYLDRATGKETILRGTGIKARTPEGLTVKVPGKTLKISALDVHDVLYTDEDVKDPDFQTYRVPFGKLDRANLPSTPEAQRPKLYKEALTAFAELLANPKLPPRSKIREHVEFKAAETAYRFAQLDPAGQDDALAALDKFSRDHSDSTGGYSPALMMLARIQEDKGDTKAVQKTYETLAAVPGISPEIRAASLLSVARLLIKTGNYAAAETKLLDLKKSLPPESKDAAEVQVYLAQCQALGTMPPRPPPPETVGQLLTTSKDAALLALVHNDSGRVLQQEE